MAQARLVFNFFVFTWIIGLTSCGPKADHEEVKEFFPNGNPKLVQVFDHAGNIIQVKTFHFNTYRESVVDYRNGKPEGTLQKWGSTGELAETSHMKQGLREGAAQTWYRKGQILSSAEYAHGLLQGELKRFHPNGDMMAQEYYQLGVPVGQWKSWFANGTLATQNSCHADVEKGFSELYQQDGILLTRDSCQHGVLQGEMLENYGNGKAKVRGQYRQGVPEGRWTWWRADGSLWQVNDYTQGRRNGVHLLLGDHGDTLEQAIFQQGSGTIQTPCSPPIPNVHCAETTWVQGKRQGKIANYFPANLLWYQELWNDDSIVHSEDWRADSLGKPVRKLLEGNWEHGKREGIWRTWHSNGKLKDSLTYSHGELWGMQFYYDSTGHLYMAKKNQGLAHQVIVKTLDPRPLQ